MTRTPISEITDFVPEFHDREGEMQRHLDATRALSLSYLNELENIKDIYADLKAKHERLLEALREKTKRSNYEWFEGYAYSPDEWVNEGQIACALEILSEVEKTEGLKK